MIGAVDIGGTKIAAGIVDDAGRVLSKLESPTDATRGYSNGLERGHLHIVSWESYSARQRLLDLLERLAFCFGKAPANEQKAGQANAGIDPEGSRRPNSPVQ